MVHSTFSVRIKQQDQIPILVNDSLEENIIASEIVQIEEPSKLSELRNQEHGNIPYANESTIPNQNIEPTNVNQNFITVIDSSNLSNGFHSSNIRNGDAFEAYETLGIGTDNLEGVDCECCRFGGRITRIICGNTMAFLSGLFFTANNFIIKAARLSFGEVLAVRSIIQIPLMSLIILMKGDSFWPSSAYQRIMLCMVGLFGSLTMLTSFACVKFMPVPDAITLIFTAPLFTMVLAAIFMKEKVTIVKVVSGMVLMAGIALITKPSFLFPDNDNGILKSTWTKANDSTDWRKEYAKGIFFLFNLKTPIPPEHDPEDYYFIGALVALSSAIFGGAIIVTTSKIGNEVSTTLQLLYIAIFAFLVAGFVEFLDEKDRFFTPDIVKITAYEWGLYIGISCSGMLGFLFEFKSCQMVPPGTVATLRTTEIVVAFVAQVLFTHIVPEFIDILGAAFVFIAAIALVFEKNIYEGISKVFYCDCCKREPSSQERLIEETNEVIVSQNNDIDE